jgi:hypothetical protein
MTPIALPVISVIPVPSIRALVTELLHSSRLLIHYIPHPRNRSCLGRHGREQGRSECGNCQRSEPQRYCHKHFPCDEHPHRNGFRRAPLLERRAALRKLIEPDPRSPIQFSDHIDCDGAKFFEAAAELGLEGIVSKRVASRYRSGPSRSWLKSKNMVEGEFILLGTERDSEGVPWALLATDRDGRLCVCRPGYHEPAAGAQSGMARTDDSIGDCQAAAARVEAGFCSMA